MERHVLNAQSRNAAGKGVARKLRAQDRVPAILYGAGEPQLLSVALRDLNQAVQVAHSLSALFDLKIDGEQTQPVMLRDYQADNISREFLHVDFQRVDMSQKVKVEVPVHLVGKAPGVKEGGILEHLRRELEIVCLPGAIPEAIEVDVSHLNIGDNIHIHDLKLPEGVELSAISDVLVAAVVEAVEQPTTTVGEEITQPEVLTEKKAAEKDAGK